MAEVRVNGVAVDALSTLDRGLAYGDGVFETLRVENGVALYWPLHRQRLLSGCQRLAIQPIDIAAIENDISQVVGAVPSGVLKVIVTRGSGGRGYRPPAEGSVTPTRIVQLHPYPCYDAKAWTQGIAVRLCTHRLPTHPALAGIKHLNRLDQVLARAEWGDADIAEGLMLDDRGFVVSGTMTNLFFVRDGVLHTPDVTTAGIAGITRQRVMLAAGELTQAVRIGRYRVEDVLRADEVFVCNSVIGIWPVARLDAHTWPVGSMTGTLMRACRAWQTGGE